MGDGPFISKPNGGSAELPLIIEKVKAAMELLTEVGEYVARVAPKHKRGVEAAKLAVQDVRLLLSQEALGEEFGVHRILAPMPGFVLRCEKRVGDKVKAGETVLVLDAMKMENQITAPADGRLLAIPLGAGSKVAKGAVLAVIG